MDENINVYDMVIKQGSTFQKIITLKNADGTPMNLTGYTARSQFRRNHRSDAVEFSMTTENGRITIDGSLGKVTLNIPASDTATLEGKYVYDLELVSGTYVDRFLQGEVTVDLEVTRA